MARKARKRNEEEDWIPQGEEDEEEDEEEGVAEGGDSVLRDQVGVAKDGGEEMDTIARTATHSYYLRSLHKPEGLPGIRGPRSLLEVPQQQEQQQQQRDVGLSAEARDYGLLPTPSLPPPPAPQGQSAADLYQSLDARDEEIRKSESLSLSLFLTHSLNLSHTLTT